MKHGMQMGCGVTAVNYEDALNILKEKVFIDGSFPDIKKVTENVDVSALDADHVRSNMMPPNARGIWYPIGHY